MLKSRSSCYLSSQIRCLLFETGVSLTPLQIDFFVSKARREVLKKLAFAAVHEGLIEGPFKAYCPLTYLARMKQFKQKQQQSAHFWAWSMLSDELEESMANLALSMAYRYVWHEKLKANKTDSLWQWALTSLDKRQRLLFFEQWGAEGHPYHPNCTAKMGMSRREVLHYSPEFQAKFTIQWLAVNKRFAKTSGKDFVRLMADVYPKEMALWRESLRKKNRNPSDYYALPVHPWQLQNTLKSLFKEQFDEHILVDGLCEQIVHPTMSFRTVVSEHQNAPHIKLATAVHTTSAMRTVSPGSVYNGPRLSVLLNTILENEHHFDKSLYVLSDLGGVHLDHTEGKHASALFRENPLNHLVEGETAVVLATLFARSPMSNKPLLIEIIEQSGLAPEAYFSLYCRRLLKGQMTLYLKYGIALEAHQQNTFMVFDKDHLPQKHLNRDLGGIRIYRPLLKRQRLFLAIDSSMPIDTNDFNEVRNKFIHANLQSNISFVLNTLASHFPGVLKEELWKCVKYIVREILDDLREDMSEKQYKNEMDTLFAKPWQFKSLLRMRLEPCQSGYLYRQIDNPLAS